MRPIRERVNMRVLSVCLLVIAVPVIILSAWSVKYVHVCMLNQQEIEESRRECEKQGQALADASDYLTNEVWRFITTGNRENLNNYWEEVDTVRRREAALTELQKQQLTEEESALVNRAKEESDDLIFTETLAMRLMAESIGMKESEMPEQVAATKLTEEEKSMNSEEKWRAASACIFGDKYSESKEIIKGNLQNFREMLRERKGRELKSAMRETEHALFVAQASNMLLLALLIVAVAAYYLLVLRPFMQYSVSLRDVDGTTGLHLIPAGSVEMRKFAAIFNHVYNMWQAQNEKLKLLNSIDALTGIPNRQTLYAYLEEQIQKNGGNLGIYMMDIDSFKSFNDTYGHQAGDKVLARIAGCLKKIMEDTGGIAGRIGGEEFVLVLPDATAEKIDRTAGEIMYAIQDMNLKHEILPLTDTHITVSLGSILWTGKEKKTPKELIHYADLALYQAKKNGKNQHVMFSENDYSFLVLQNNRTHDSEVEADMYRALENGEFIPWYQPQYDLKTERIVSVEALVRWNHPQKGILYPDYFIPLFERNGFILKMDLCVFERVCQDLKAWISQGQPAVTAACNFSRLHFAKEGLAEDLSAVADRYGIPHEYLEIEITESALMENSQNIITELNRLRDCGFTVAIDDFGVGYSSLGILSDVPADVLKIDRGFLNRDMTDRKNVMIVRGIVNIANILHLKTICEGVETYEQKELLKSIGCDLAQGYYYAKPMDRKKLEELVMRSDTTDCTVIKK